MPAAELVDVVVVVVVHVLVIVLVRVVHPLVPRHEAPAAGHRRDDLTDAVVVDVTHAIADLQTVVRRLQRSRRARPARARLDRLNRVLLLPAVDRRGGVRGVQVRQRLLRRLEQEGHRRRRPARAVCGARANQNIRVRQKVQHALPEAQVRHARGVGREEPEHQPRRDVHDGEGRGSGGGRGTRDVAW